MAGNYIPANNFAEALGLLGQACKGVPVQFRLTPEEAVSEESQWNHYVAAYRACKTTQKCGANVSYDLFRPDPVAVMRCKAGIGTASEVACDAPDKRGCLRGISESAPLPDFTEGYIDKPDPDDSPVPVAPPKTAGINWPSTIISFAYLGIMGYIAYDAFYEKKPKRRRRRR